jgi:hypothetical protein
MLRDLLITKITEGLRKGDDVLHGDNYSLKKVSERGGQTKACRATFYGKEEPKTKFGWGGESYYAPMSVLGFLQERERRDQSLPGDLKVEKVNMNGRFPWTIGKTGGGYAQLIWA